MNESTVNVLRIDASARQAGSISRELGDAVEAALLEAHPGATVTRREVQMIPHIANETIAGFYTPLENRTPDLLEATALSDALIAELRAADVLLLTTPMYNFSIPSALKAWLDQVIRINETFGFDGSSLTGMLRGKRAIVVSAFGLPGYKGGALEPGNFVEPYLKYVLNFIGIADVQFVNVEATAMDAAATRAAVEAVKRELRTPSPTPIVLEPSSAQKAA
jgi:FMN-dependent NADH-azoreductase